MIILKCLILVGAAILVMFLIRKTIECIINLSVLLKKENYYDSTKQHQGIVFNKRKKKLEADNSLILPF